MAWAWLMAAGICEIIWAVGLKYSNGLSRPLASAVTIVTMLLSFALLAQAMRWLPLGTAYAVWTGIGAVGTTLWGIAVFNESRDWPRLACIGLIVLGIVGLRLLAPPAAAGQ